jgi:hypothetical protein
VNYVHELAKDLPHRWARIATGWVRSRYHNLLYRPILLALVHHIVLEVLNKLLVVEVFDVAHVEELDDSAGNLAELIIF